MIGSTWDKYEHQRIGLQATIDLIHSEINLEKVPPLQKDYFLAVLKQAQDLLNMLHQIAYAKKLAKHIMDLNNHYEEYGNLYENTQQVLRSLFSVVQPDNFHENVPILPLLQKFNITSDAVSNSFSIAEKKYLAPLNAFKCSLTLIASAAVLVLMICPPFTLLGSIGLGLYASIALYSILIPSYAVTAGLATFGIIHNVNLYREKQVDVVSQLKRKIAEGFPNQQNPKNLEDKPSEHSLRN